MTAQFPSPPVVDDEQQLAQAITFVKPHLRRSIPVGDRLRAFWAAVVAGRDLAESDVIFDEFMKLARDTGLAADLGYHADADLRHVIRWAQLGQNPFQ